MQDLLLISKYGRKRRAMGFSAPLALSGLLALIGSMRKYHGKCYAD